jgi:hypothetical protein
MVVSGYGRSDRALHYAQHDAKGLLWRAVAGDYLTTCLGLGSTSEREARCDARNGATGRVGAAAARGLGASRATRARISPDRGARFVDR